MPKEPLFPHVPKSRLPQYVPYMTFDKLSRCIATRRENQAIFYCPASTIAIRRKALGSSY